MRILGIDPGMQRLGFSLIDFDEDTRELHPKYFGFLGRVRRESEQWNDYLDSQIGDYCDNFPRLLHLYEPKLIVSEIVPPGRLGSNSELVFVALTVCKTIAWQHGIKWERMAANTVKKIIADNGKASKAQIRNALIKRYPRLGEVHKNAKTQQKEAGEKVVGVAQDAFDALAVPVAFVEKKYGKAS